MTLIDCLLLLAGVVAPASGTAAPAVATGYASAYATGVMESVVRLRFERDWWPTPPPRDWYTVAGYAATTDCAAVGRVVDMRPAGATRWARILVADCAGPDSHQWMLDNGIVAELDAATFTRWAARYGRPLAMEMRR